MRTTHHLDLARLNERDRARRSDHWQSIEGDWPAQRRLHRATGRMLRNAVIVLVVCMMAVAFA